MVILLPGATSSPIAKLPLYSTNRFLVFVLSMISSNVYSMSISFNKLETCSLFNPERSGKVIVVGSSVQATIVKGSKSIVTRVMIFFI